MTGNLNGKTALITGSTRRGIGAASAMHLALEGANVILNYGSKSKDADAKQRAETLTQSIAETGAHVGLIVADIKSESEVRELFRQANDRFGGVDILVNNAGGAWIEQDFATIETTHWDQAIRAEIDGTFYCIREALPHMRHGHWGRIINICLNHETLTLLINAHYGNTLDKYPYDFALAKSAKAEITRLLALAEYKHGITINNILPGVIEEIDNDDALRKLRGADSKSIYFDPTDVARAVAFLCSEDARGITHSDLRIPGNLYTRL
jgi:glucose 1-dehydrogenase